MGKETRCFVLSFGKRANVFWLYKRSLYHVRWMHDFAIVFIWRLNVIPRSMYGCGVDKGWTVVVCIVSNRLNWKYISQNPCTCRGGPKRNLHEVLKAGMKHQTLLSEGHRGQIDAMTDTEKCWSVLSVLDSSTPLSALLPNCWSRWPVVASGPPLVTGQQTQRSSSHSEPWLAPLMSPWTFPLHFPFGGWMCLGFRLTDRWCTYDLPASLLDLHFPKCKVSFHCKFLTY